MGCRAVICDKDTTIKNANTKIGIYVHSYGDEDTIKRLLAECKKRKMRGVISDPQYGWARACQAFGDVMTQDDMDSPWDFAKDHAYDNGLGIGIVAHLDCWNGDNGVYYIDDDFNIVRHTSGEELKISPEDWLALEEEKVDVQANMETYGGDFVKGLAAALLHADPDNTLKIKNTWTELWDKYLNFGKKD